MLLLRATFMSVWVGLASMVLLAAQARADDVRLARPDGMMPRQAQKLVMEKQQRVEAQHQRRSNEADQQDISEPTGSVSRLQKAKIMTMKRERLDRERTEALREARPPSNTRPASAVPSKGQRREICNKLKQIVSQVEGPEDQTAYRGREVAACGGV